MSKTKEKTPYIGSVRFYKHVILTTIGLMILIPTALSVVFGIRMVNLSSENMDLKDELVLAKREVEAVQGSEAEEADVLDVHEGSPKMTVGEEDLKEWNLVLVNESSPLEADYKVELKAITGGQKVDTRIVKPLTDMMSQMRKEGMYPIVCSGYRSIEKQSRLFHEYIDEKVDAGWEYGDAFYKAKTRIALPGTSEHHTGLAVDIVGMTHQSLDDAQANTPEAKWLAEHCAEYGFILRYPEDKTDITGIDYESWHFRYVGEEVAAYIMENELTLEEFLESVDK